MLDSRKRGYAAYYKAFPNDAESNLEFNKADAIANAMAKTTGV